MSPYGLYCYCFPRWSPRCPMALWLWPLIWEMRQAGAAEYSSNAPSEEWATYHGWPMYINILPKKLNKLLDGYFAGIRFNAIIIHVYAIVWHFYTYRFMMHAWILRLQICMYYMNWWHHLPKPTYRYMYCLARDVDHVHSVWHNLLRGITCAYMYVLQRPWRSKKYWPQH